MKRTITETFDEEGRVTERVTVEEEETAVAPAPAPVVYYYGCCHGTCACCYHYYTPYQQPIVTYPQWTVTTGNSGYSINGISNTTTSAGSITNWTYNGDLGGEGYANT
jgi:hypothetical protein